MKLTDTQMIILSTAAQRTDRLALPLPKSLRGGAAQKVVNALVEKGLLEEVEANRKLDDPVWRETGDGHAVTLVATDAGLSAIGVELPRKAKTHAAPAAPKRREGTKQSAMIEMLSRRDGATIDEIAAATGWQQHTIRGAMAGALKKKLGLEISSDKVDGRGRVYKIAA